MKKLTPSFVLPLALFVLCFGAPVMAQDAAIVADTTTVAVEKVAKEYSGFWATLIANTTVIGLFLATVFSLIHMLYVRFRLSPRYKQQFDVDYFKSVRAAMGKEEEATAEENDLALSYLNKFVDGWQLLPQKDAETGDDLYLPTKRNHIRTAVEVIDAAIALAPTDPYVVDEINRCAETININEERTFSGSKLFIRISLIFAVATIFITKGFAAMICMIIGTIMYYLASSRPLFLLNKEKKGKMGCLNSIFLGVFTAVLEARTITTTTTYSDGSRDVDEDYSEHWISWIMSIVVMSFLASTIVIWSLINYLRNYVLYR